MKRLFRFCYLFGWLLGGFLTLATAWAQCCSPGNPIGGAVNPGVNPEGSWQLFLGYRYGYAGRYFRGSEPIASGAVQSGEFQHLSLAVTYGLAERLTIEAETGYFLEKSQRYAPGLIPAQQTGRGFTDLNLLARVNLWQDAARGWELTTGVGLKLPLGPYQQQVDGILLPRDLQPSTGSVDFLHTVFLQKAFLPRKFRLFFLSRLEWKGQTPDQYRHGHFLALGAFFSYSPHLRWTLVAQLRGEWRGRDTRPFTGGGIPIGQGREVVPPTGSQKLFFSPQVGHQLSPTLQLTLLGDLPLYQYYFASQLGSNWGLWVNVNQRF